MEIIKGDLLKIENKKYMTLEILMHENNKYAFVNEVTANEEVTEDFYILKVLEDGVRIVIEENLQKVLIPKFQDLLKQDIKDLIK